MLREGRFPAPVRTETHEVVIVGGGIAAFSAARILSAAGIRDICLLELAEKTGGNAAYGQNDFTRYPWGAHYLPLPDPQMKELLAFLEERKIITGYDEKGLPVYEETMLCHDPQERLFINYRWQDGLIPEFGLEEKELAGIRRFLALMEKMKQAKGSDGKYAFSLPVDESSTDEEYTRLDKITMKAWMASERFDSPALLWYVDYCCRDDYGTSVEITSAWAGIHYFASRRGQASNAESAAVLTWPEGNGFLADELKASYSGRLLLQSVVYNIAPQKEGVLIEYYDAQKKESVRIQAKKCIAALPQYVLKKILHLPGRDTFSEKFSYSPWLVANVTLKNFPEGKGQPLSWDNVIYGSESLGYVNACHQHIGSKENRTVVTFYLPFAKGQPSEQRKHIREKDHVYWVQQVTAELEKAHHGISELITNIDVWIWGHAMVRPVTHFVFSPERRAARASVDQTLFFAHSDLGGISVFEEAFFQGVRAAKELLATPNSI